MSFGRKNVKDKKGENVRKKTEKEQRENGKNGKSNVKEEQNLRQKGRPKNDFSVFRKRGRIFKIDTYIDSCFLKLRCGISSFPK
jgi:hypothetical protein